MAKSPIGEGFRRASSRDGQYGVVMATIKTSDDECG
jgi:hypothetical protein